MNHHLLTRRDESAFTLIEIMVVVCLIGLLAAIAVPNFVNSRRQAQLNGCINNLRQIDAAKEQLAMEAKLTSGTAVTAPSVHTYIKGDPNPPICPASGSYSYNAIGTNPTCNITGHAYGGSSSSSSSGGSSSGGSSGGSPHPPPSFGGGGGPVL